MEVEQKSHRHVQQLHVTHQLCLAAPMTSPESLSAFVYSGCIMEVQSGNRRQRNEGESNSHFLRGEPDPSSHISPQRQRLLRIRFDLPEV